MSIKIMAYERMPIRVRVGNKEVDQISILHPFADNANGQNGGYTKERHYVFVTKVLPKGNLIPVVLIMPSIC